MKLLAGFALGLAVGYLIRPLAPRADVTWSWTPRWEDPL